jgi:predicted enzyme related to lactoylglutathione lyase
MLKDATMYSYIPVADLARARQFYEGVLGLVPKEELSGGIAYRCGGGTGFFMYRSGGAGTSKASQAFWQVLDVEAEVAQLRKRGVVFEEYDRPGFKTKNGILSAGGAKTAWFKDTEGNILAIVQPV